MVHQPTDRTIAAIATPQGRGGIGIIRISGAKVSAIATALLGKLPPPRYAHHSRFVGEDGTAIDEGLVLYFPAPHSFTGEDVLELQGHGGPIILDALLKRAVMLGAELARPGEFSERAFLNGKMDLAQAEAVADLIDAASLQAAQSALRSLQGEFSARIVQLVAELTQLRMVVEAAIDFPEEEVDFLADSVLLLRVENVLAQLHDITANAQQGVLLREGATIVLAGCPNVGKSSLLNRLSGEETAIVTEIPGTTRDLLKTQIQIDGLPLHIIDTAGLRDSADVVEQEGIRRAQQAINNADLVLLLLAPESPIPIFSQPVPAQKLIRILNKIDLIDQLPQVTEHPDGHWEIAISAKTGAGIDLLRQHLKMRVGYQNHGEGIFSARRRHLQALETAGKHMQQGLQQLQEYQAGELLAEELRLAQNALAEITGQFLPDDLLAKIFSEFCIGK